MENKSKILKGFFWSNFSTFLTQEAQWQTSPYYIHELGEWILECIF